jgi:hypothetical protein
VNSSLYEAAFLGDCLWEVRAYVLPAGSLHSEFTLKNARYDIGEAASVVGAQRCVLWLRMHGHYLVDVSDWFVG